MANKQVTIDVNVDTKKSVQNVGNLNKEIEKTAEKIKSPAQQLKLLEDRMAAIGNVGSKEFQRLAKESGKLKDQINNAKAATRALSSDFPRLQLGAEAFKAIGGAAQVAMGATALLGSENQELTKSIQKMVAIQSVMNGLNTIAAALSDETLLGIKARIALQKVQAVVTKGLAAAQRIMNAVMNANPIMLIVTGIGLLIAGIVLLIKNIEGVIDWLKSMAKYMLLLLGPIGLIIMAFTNLGETQESEAEKEKRRDKERREAYKKRIEAIEEIIEVEKKAGEDRQKLYQDEIERLESLGLNADKTRRAMLEGAVNASNAALKREKELSDETIEEYNVRMGTNFKTQDEIIKYFKKSKEEELGILWAADEDELEVLNSRVTNNKRAADELRKSTDNLEKDKTKAREESHKKYMAMLEARKQAERELIKAETDGWLKYEENRLEMMDDGLEKELALAQFHYEQQTKDLNDQLASHAAIRIQEETKLQELLYSINAKYAKKKQQVQVEVGAQTLVLQEKSSIESQQSMFDRMSEKVGMWQQNNAETIQKLADSFAVASAAIAGSIDIAQQALNMKAEAASEKRQEQYESDSEALKASLANREISQQQYEDKLALLEKDKAIKERQAKRKAFEQNKAFQIVNAVMNTAQAVMAGLAAPFPVGIVMGALNAAIGVAQIGIIASQKFKAAKGGVVPGAPSNVDSVDALLAPGEMVINSQSASMFPQTLSSINQAGGGVSLAPQIATSSGTSTTYRENEQQTVKAYVVETEITDKQKKVSRIERAAQF